jgi:cell wall-associated NlpC family hydrolase
MTKDEIVAAARKELGTPFKHQARLSGVALDCVGLASIVARNWYTPVEPLAYGRTPDNGMLQMWLGRQYFLETADEMQAGDFLLMRFGKEPQHMAIFTGSTIIHAYQSIGKVVEHGMDEKWRNRVVKIYRMKGVK